MELHERLVTTKPAAAAPPTREPFADLKNSIHMLVISELGPQLTGQTIDPVGLRDRVLADIRRHLANETGISRDDRERLTLGDRGRHPRLRAARAPPADDSITEIMVNGPGEIWIERQGRLYETTVRFTDDSHLRRIINRMVAQIGRRIDESSPMVDARLPDGSRVNAIIAPALALGPAAHDPQVLAQAPRAPGHGQPRLAQRGVGRLPQALHPGAAQRAHLRRYRLGQDDAPERALVGDPRQRADRDDRGRGRAPAQPAPRAPARGAPAEHRGRGSGADPRPRAQLAAHAARPDHRRRVPRPRRRSTCSRR